MMITILIKVLIIIICVPAYPFLVIGQYVERKSYLGSRVKFREVNADYWADVWDAVTYRKRS